MKNKFFSILLLFAFIAIILQPAMPFVQYYFGLTDKNVVVEEPCDCNCPQDGIAKMANNGDAYLRALIKRTCNDNKKNTSKTTFTGQIVFVKVLMRDFSIQKIIPETLDNKISDFIIQSDLKSYHQDILRPPLSA